MAKQTGMHRHSVGLCVACVCVYREEDEERELHRKRTRKPDEQLKPDASSKPKPDLPR